MSMCQCQCVDVFSDIDIGGDVRMSMSLRPPYIGAHAHIDIERVKREIDKKAAGG